MKRQAIILSLIIFLIIIGFVFFRDDKELPKVEPTPSREMNTEKIYFEKTNCVEGGIVVECKG